MTDHTECEWLDELRTILDQIDLLDSAPLSVTPLLGGVSSDIFLVTAGSRKLCAKRALPKLKVAADWRVSVDRARYEAAWLQFAAGVCQSCAPTVLAFDEANGITVLEYLPPDQYALWKDELLAGRVDVDLARRVGQRLGAIHQASAGSQALAQQFDTAEFFDDIRLSPYLRASADKHPDLSARLNTVADATKQCKIALTHGDVSPKNILFNRSTGEQVFLDAECDWFGDPAFDGAFCMNHFLLKALHLPACAPQLLDALWAFHDSWLAALPDEISADTASRTGTLLPMLMLARIDGKSPVEYLSEPVRAATRTLARELIASGTSRVQDSAEATLRTSSTL